jgi:secreted PhoX family phosphatase
VNISRRTFITLAGVSATTVVLSPTLRNLYNKITDGQFAMAKGFGKLIQDPNGILDLPQGFQYKILSQEGDIMSDGTPVPSAADGMGVFLGANNTTILVRNHELSPGETPYVIAAENKKYDPLSNGGTTTLIIDNNRNLIKQYVSLAGTNRNCAGGTTPWGSWISCEEDVNSQHGYNFEVPAHSEIVTPVPLKAMGRFRHEAISVDVNTGYIYQTEDQNDSCFYRFRPHQTGNLKAGGILEALIIDGMPTIDTSLNFPLNQTKKVKWVQIENVDPPLDSLRQEAQNKGAAIFKRGEGICLAEGMIYWTCTSGGKAEKGQIFRYHPQKETIELFLESPNANTLDYPDNLIMSPFGDLIVCEDGQGEQFLVGVTPEGDCYHFAHNALNNSEFAGICFSPDGKTMFVNIYEPALTLAIWGPWKQKYN